MHFQSKIGKVKLEKTFFKNHPENKFQKSTFPISTVDQLFIALLLSRM
jgi:hypothetical protein